MARRFVFTLEALLHQRVRAERDAQLGMAAAERGRLAAQSHLAQAEALQSYAAQEAAALDGQGFDRTVQENALYYVATARQGVAHAQARVAAAERDCQAARGAVQTAMRAREGLERLRERRKEEFQHEQAVRAERAIDDLIGARYHAPPAH
jgi:flagellar export protein FliJ